MCAVSQAFPMQLRHMKTIQPTTDVVSGKFAHKITALAWSPNNRLAVATGQRVVNLYDESGELKDKFTTRPAEKDGARNYIVRALEWSSDSTKLAVAQSDQIVFVYKLGAKWGDEKKIVNKFQVPSAVTAMCWPHNRPNDIVFGCADGKVYSGSLKSNKAVVINDTENYVVSMAASAGDGSSVVTGHLDHSIYRVSFSDVVSKALVAQCPFIPYALAWGVHICAAGASNKVLFYDAQGKIKQTIEQGGSDEKSAAAGDTKLKEFTCASVSPSGQTIVLGNFNK